MPQPQVETPFPPEALVRPMQLETDTFCTGCGYNLHGQIVTRDPRVGILLCRCPECGQYHPAGTGVTAVKPWLNRLGVGLLGGYVLLCVAILLFVAFGLGALQYGFLEATTDTVQIAPDGSPVQWNGMKGKFGYYAPGATTPTPVIITKKVINTRVFDWQRWNTASVNDGLPPIWMVFLPFVIASAVLAGGTGGFLAIAFWHWKRRARCSLFAPFLIGACACFLWQTEPGADWLRGWSIQWILIWSLTQAAFLAAGLWLGRRAARLALRMFLPPRPRQYFAFLWTVDGKTPPSAGTPDLPLTPPAHP